MYIVFLLGSFNFTNKVLLSLYRVSKKTKILGAQKTYIINKQTSKKEWCWNLQDIKLCAAFDVTQKTVNSKWKWCIFHPIPGKMKVWRGEVGIMNNITSSLGVTKSHQNRSMIGCELHVHTLPLHISERWKSCLFSKCWPGGEYVLVLNWAVRKVSSNKFESLHLSKTSIL